MEDKDVLIPNTELVKIKNKTYKISKLTLFQALQISKFLTKTFFANPDKVNRFSDSTKNNSTNVQDLLDLISLLEEKDIGELFSIILKESDVGLLSNISLEDSVEVFTILCKFNKIDTVKKNFEQIQKMMTNKNV